MNAKLTLQPGEELLFKVPVSLVTGRLATRTGMCYLTNRRIVVDSETLIAGVSAAISILARTGLRKLKLLGTRRQEIALRELTGVEMQKYGLNQTVNIPLNDGTQVRMVLGAKSRQRFLQTLEAALRDLGLELVPKRENAWRVRRAL